MATRIIGEGRRLWGHGGMGHPRWGIGGLKEPNVLGRSVYGGEGDDRLYGAAGMMGSFPDWDDYIDGGPGRQDSVDFESGRVWASLSVGVPEGEGNDTLTGIEFLWGSDYDDTLIGDAGPNH